MISVLILTFNEERNICKCLESVSWSDDILVIDSFSSDRTTNLALQAGARVLQNRFVNFAEQRNYGLNYGQLKNDWVLHLDADEIISQRLKEELFAIAAAPDEVKAYRVASKFMLEDKWLKYSSMYPAYQVRFGRRDLLRFIQVGHGQREDLPESSIGTLKEPLIHYSLDKGLEDWFAKHNRYSSAEAIKTFTSPSEKRSLLAGLFSKSPTSRRHAAKALAAQLPCRPFLRFFYMYFLRLGFLDGPAGWRYCKMLSIYESMIALKVAELRRLKPAGAQSDQGMKSLSKTAGS